METKELVSLLKSVKVLMEDYHNNTGGEVLQLYCKVVLAIDKLERVL